MEERRKTLVAVAIIVGFLVLVVVVIGSIISGKKIVSPVPEDSAIKIIYLTPTPTPLPSLSPTPSNVPTKKSS